MTTIASVPARRTDQSTSKLLRLLKELKQAAMEWVNDNVVSLSASLTFYTLLSLAPLVIIILKVLSVAFRGETAHKKLHDLVAAQIGASASTAIDAILN